MYYVFWKSTGSYYIAVALHYEDNYMLLQPRLYSQVCKEIPN